MRYSLYLMMLGLCSFISMMKCMPLLETGRFVHAPALPTKEMRLAQLTTISSSSGNEPDGNVGLATQAKEAHYATLDTHITWSAARKYCKQLGYRLCHLKELCPGGEGSEPVGAGELPNKQVFVAIKGPASQPRNVYAALTAGAGDGICTRKLNPEFAQQRANPPKGITKSLVACCSTKFLQKRGFPSGVIGTIRVSNSASERFFLRRARRASRIRREREREAREAAERKRQEEAERKRVARLDEEGRRLEFDSACVNEGVSVAGDRKSVTANANDCYGNFWRPQRSKQIYSKHIVRVAVRIKRMPNEHMMIGFAKANDQCGPLCSFSDSIKPGGRYYYTRPPHAGSPSIYPEGNQYGERYFAGDTIGAVLDYYKGTITFFKNGKSMGVAYRNVNEPLRFVVLMSHQGTVDIVQFDGE